MSAVHPAPSADAAPPRRHGLNIDPQTRLRFRALFAEPEDGGGGRGLQALLARLRTVLPGRSSRPADPPLPARDLVTGWLPQVQPAAWPPAAPVAEAIPATEQALDGAEAALAALRRDLHAADLPPLGRVQAAADGVVDAMLLCPDAMAWLARPRGRAGEAYSHGVLCAMHLVALGRHLGLPREPLRKLCQIGLLADVGMHLLPPEVVLRAGRPTPADQSVIREHVMMGLSALGGSTRLAPEVRDGIAQHHERLDGSGYPEGARGSAVGIWGRMAAVVDGYVTLASRRPGNRPVAPQDALMSLLAHAGARFYAPLVEQFARAIGPFPVGSLVELGSGEIGVVLERSPDRPLEPRLLVLTDARHETLARPVERDLRSAAIDGGGARVKRGLHAGAFGLSAPDRAVMPAAARAA